MAWETRSNGRRYYTRSRRVDGRVVREYVGGGERGEQAEAEDQKKRREREARRRAVRELVSRVDNSMRLIDDIKGFIDVVAAASLLMSGYYFHRGEWRRPNDRKK